MEATGVQAILFESLGGNIGTYAADQAEASAEARKCGSEALSRSRFENWVHIRACNGKVRPSRSAVPLDLNRHRSVFLGVVGG